MKRARARTVWFLAGCLLASYIYAVCGPLKMAGDSPGYIELAAYLQHGTLPKKIAAPGYPYYFPRGYPWILVGLNLLGWPKRRRSSRSTSRLLPPLFGCPSGCSSTSFGCRHLQPRSLLP